MEGRKGGWREAACTHHFLVRELPPLDAAAVPDGLLVAHSLGVAEQVHLRGDLPKHKQEVRGQRRGGHPGGGSARGPPWEAPGEMIPYTGALNGTRPATRNSIRH